MKKSRFTEQQIAYALRQAESGVPIEEITRKMGITQATFVLTQILRLEFDIVDLLLTSAGFIELLQLGTPFVYLSPNFACFQPN